MDPRPISSIMDPAVTSLPFEPMVGNGVALGVALLLFLAVGAVLFFWRRQRTRRYQHASSVRLPG